MQFFIHYLHILGFFYIQNTYCHEQHFLIAKYILILYRSEKGFQVSPYNKNLYKKEVKKQELEELYREYFMARYKGYDIFVFSDSKEDREIEIVTYDSNIGRVCGLDQRDRDLFTKRLGHGDEYQLFYVKEDYLNE